VTAAAIRARSTSLSLVRAVPVWAWLCAIVVVSAAVRYVLARRVVAPWIMVDELIYSELAKSFAATGHFLVRGQPSGGYGIVYPVVIAPAFRAFTSIPTAYEAAKAINSIVMSLTAIPVYFLARRMLSPALALVAALLALAIPSMLYTGTLMTENAFYPLFMAVALALVLVLERPTWQREAVLLALCAFAFLTRAQAVALLPAVITAPLLLAWFDGRRRALKEYRVLWAATFVAVVVLPLLQIARGSSVLALFGAYAKAGETHYDVAAVLRWLLYHVAELDLYLAVIPFAAFIVLVALARRVPRRVQVFLAASVALTVWLVVEVAIFASKNPIPPRVEERNMFYVAPLFLIALLVWIDLGLPRRHIAAGVAAVVAAALPGALPFATLIGVPAASDELALSIWWRLQDELISLDHVAMWAVIAAIVLATLFLIVPQRWAAVLPAVVVAAFVAVTWTAGDDVHGFKTQAVGALFQGMTNEHRDWIDRAVGPHADVAVLWTACSSNRCLQPRSQTDVKVVWENEFFSRSVRDVYVLKDHDALPGGLAARPAEFDFKTGLFTTRGRPLRAQYALLDSSVDPVGTAVARDEKKGVAVWRLRGPLRQATQVTGLYPDSWSGPYVRYFRRACEGGTLRAVVQSDPSLIRRPQTVTALVNDRLVARARVGAEPASLVVPLRPRGGRCTVDYVVKPTAVPGHGDPRQLGVHFLALEFTPPK
jgi:4-amino-4-deoxy-L-arabinose transferase-like glycosyltransferase